MRARPAINDPGLSAPIEAAVAAGFAVQVIPGPSAVIAALLSSGLPTSSFAFKGFPPRKSGQRQRLLESRGRAARDTLIFFESPHRLGQPSWRTPRRCSATGRPPSAWS